MDLICFACALEGVDTPAVTQYEGTLYCRDHAQLLGAQPRMQARLGLILGRSGLVSPPEGQSG